ncbi:MAG: SET domain-containing protein, partial [Bdellovibrionales bacterium]
DSPREVSAPEYLSDYVAEISGGVTIDALDPVTKRVKCSAGYFNDGFDPEKANARFEVRDGKLFVVAARPIAENEEITIAYGPAYWLSSKWPSAILEKAYNAYKRLTPTAEFEAQWTETINARIREENGLSAEGVHGALGPGAIERIPLRRLKAGRDTTHLAFGDPHLVFSTWNAGYLGGALDQSTLISDYFKEMGIDCLVLQDTRCTKSQSRFQAAALASRIRGSKVISIPTMPAIQVDGQYSPAMGGTMVILSERAARLYKGHEADKTGMGLIVRVHFAIRQSPSARPWSFQVIAAYLPPKPGSNPGINTMWS